MQLEMARAYSVSQVLKTRHKTLEFTGDWLDLIGKPEVTGSWFIWGNSFNGKTFFALSLAKYLASFGKVAYNSLEEGRCESVRQSYANAGMEEVEGNLLLLDREPLEELVARLKKPKSPKFIVIDSLQYFALTATSYANLRKNFRNKLFIFLSHADGKHPAGTLAKQIRYDAFVKIRIEGFSAFATSRFGGNQAPYVIWEERADTYWKN